MIDATGLATDAAVRRYPGGTLRVDVGRAGRIASACAGAAVPLLTLSSDHVFDGRLGRPACETDPLTPEGQYGTSLAAAEAEVRARHPRALIVRTGFVFDAPAPEARPEDILAALGAAVGMPPREPETLSLSYLPDLAHAALDLLIDGEAGPWHLANRGPIARDEVVAALACALRGHAPPHRGLAAADAQPGADQRRAASSCRPGPVPWRASGTRRARFQPPTPGRLLNETRRWRDLGRAAL